MCFIVLRKGIFLKTFKGCAHETDAALRRGGSCNRERALERVAQGHFPARRLKADDTLPAFLASVLIFRVLPNETQARSQFATHTRNIPELGISENKAR
jgi:hypothetical protein